jgi:hypothetical protein
MPWRATEPIQQGVPCRGAYLRHLDTMTALCERRGMRRHTGDTWGRRYTAAAMGSTAIL